MEALETIGSANLGIRALLSSIERLGSAAALKPAGLPQILQLMRIARKSLRRSPERTHTPALQALIAEYRCNVEQLGKALPGIYASLLAEKCRLQNARQAVASAQAWAEAQKATLSEPLNARPLHRTNSGT